MTALNFRGKEFVFNHHLTVPYRNLLPHPDKGIGEPTLDGNLIIHGDNLHALKSLVPRYADKVDCIFIDPPYNTGNEGWCYNDNLNAPMIKDWLRANPIGIEDGLRHDKWCCMMWPRLRLLHDLLAESGAIFVSIDDNEFHRLRHMMDEIFEEDNFIASFVWHHRKSSQNDINISLSHNFVLCYAKRKEKFNPRRDPIDASQYSNPDNDELGPWKLDPMDAPNIRKNLTYPITNPKTGLTHLPPKGRCWRFSPDEFKKALIDNRIVFGRNGDSRPQYKRYLKDAENTGKSIPTIWNTISTATDAKYEINKIFDNKNMFETPKPSSLLAKIINIAAKPNGVILDSFAGSGTTAQAVLELNKKDGGNRRFILIEMEEYADRLTAERVRRVINGYRFSGTQREELFRENITWSKLRNPEKIMSEVEIIENLNLGKFEKIKKSVRNGELTVSGEKKILEKVEGVKGSFTYCTLSESFELDKLLTGDLLPDFEAIGTVLFYTATKRTINPKHIRESEFYLGKTDNHHLWLIYKPDIVWLKSPEAALSLSRAREFVETDTTKKHLVFAPVRYISQKVLEEQGLPVEFVPLPYALFRLNRG